MKLRSIKEVKNLKGKRVFLRVDFNVALQGTRVIEDYRIERVVPTIKYLLKNKCQVVIGAHLGRPAGAYDSKFSLKPIHRVLQKYMGATKVKFETAAFDEKLVKKIKGSSARVILLDNLRFHFGEEKNDLQFAQLLASLGDIYVNDAFGVCHREATSVSAITKLLPSYAGLNLLNEVKYLSSAMTPPQPAVAIIGGIKLDSKFGVIKNFLKKYDKILVGGGVAHVFLKSEGYEIGDSLYDPAYFEAAKKIKNNKKIVRPVDFIVADTATKRQIKYATLTADKKICDTGEMILDIGPETVKRYVAELQSAKTIVCGGPMGMIDMKEFSNGSVALVKAVVQKKRQLAIAGGGETITVINRLRLGKKFNFISTGGGAMLEFLEGKKLPGIKPLLKK
jgi:phosphoglycerate kinase